MNLKKMNEPLRLAMLGMVPGNGHPYSWSAIFNGYDPQEMANCPYPAIPQYLGKEPKESVAYKIAAAAVPELAEKTLIPIYMPMIKNSLRFRTFSFLEASRMEFTNPKMI